MAARKPPATKTVDDVLKAVLVLSRTVEYVLETRVAGAAANGPLSPSKVKILRLLGQRRGQSSTQVACFLGVSKPAVTQIIDSMIRDKLVTRSTVLHDRRKVNLQLTRKGRDLHHALRRTQRHYIRNVLKNQVKRDAERWVKALHDISVLLARADKAFEQFCAQCGAHKDGTCVLVGGDATCLYLQSNRR